MRILTLRGLQLALFAGLVGPSLAAADPVPITSGFVHAGAVDPSAQFALRGGRLLTRRLRGGVQQYAVAWMRPLRPRHDTGFGRGIPWARCCRFGRCRRRDVSGNLSRRHDWDVLVAVVSDLRRPGAHHYSKLHFYGDDQRLPAQSVRARIHGTGIHESTDRPGNRTRRVPGQRGRGSTLLRAGPSVRVHRRRAGTGADDPPARWHRRGNGSIAAPPQPCGSGADAADIPAGRRLLFVVKPI